MLDTYLHPDALGHLVRCLRRPTAPTADDILAAHAAAFPERPRPVSWQAALKELREGTCHA